VFQNKNRKTPSGLLMSNHPPVCPQVTSPNLLGQFQTQYGKRTLNLSSTFSFSFSLVHFKDRFAYWQK
jgi:hypothetical protein